MNQSDYASFEAAHRLVAAGILLEAEAGWISERTKDGIVYKLMHKEEIHGAYYPAPSMAEVWRELPERLDVTDLMKPHSYIRLTKFHGETVSGYGVQPDVGKRVNPADALIDLLIWVRKEA